MRTYYRTETELCGCIEALRERQRRNNLYKNIKVTEYKGKKYYTENGEKIFKIVEG